MLIPLLILGGLSTYIIQKFIKEEINKGSLQLLQPLIENSIYHGIRGKKGRSGIKIKIYKENQHLLITIIDNGLGIAPEKLRNIQQKLSSDNDFGTHIGLYNTNKRLQIAYKDEYYLKIKSKLNFGTLVHFRIPIKNTTATQLIEQQTNKS